MRQAAVQAEISITLVTVSDRAHSGEREDRSGPVAVAALAEAGFAVSRTMVIPDGRESVESALAERIRAGTDVVITIGGTGVGHRDETPEGTRPLIARELPGIMERMRAVGATEIPTAVLSRGLAGISAPSDEGHRTVLVNLPGSTGGARDGISYLSVILRHLVEQVRGGDH